MFKKQFFHCRENPIVSVWQCRATMNILSSPNNSKTSILDFPPPNAKCDKKSKTLIALRAMQQLIFNQTFTARLYCSFLFSCSWNCHVPECWRGAPCHHDHDHDQSWLIMTKLDQSWPILTNRDQSWPIMTNHYHLTLLKETWVFGRRSLPRTSFNLLYWSSRPSWTSFHLQI